MACRSALSGGTGEQVLGAISRTAHAARRAAARVVIPFIGMQFHWTVARPSSSMSRQSQWWNRVHRHVEPLGVMHIGPREGYRQRHAVTVHHNIALRAQLAAIRRTLAGLVASPGAGTLAPPTITAVAPHALVATMESRVFMMPDIVLPNSATLLRAIASSSSGLFTGTLIIGGLALLFIAFAWDGLVRREMLLHAFPIGGGSITLRRVVSLVIGLLAAILAAFLLLFAGGFYLTGIQSCAGSYSCLVGSVQPFAWIWFGLFFGWFTLVWLRVGNPRKRVLVYGVWYYQQRAAGPVIERIRTLGLPAMAQARLYALEEAVVGELHAQGWLVHGKVWLDGEQRTARIAPLTEIITAVQHGLENPLSGDDGAGANAFVYQDVPSEREAVAILVDYFLRRAEKAKRMSPVARWWVGSGQLGKWQVYGRRAI